jgi:DNA-binding response OmpR family regulator
MSCDGSSVNHDVPTGDAHPDAGSGNRTPGKQTIVMYSPDVDLCMSLTLYFQDKYVVVTTTDGNTLPTLVDTYRPALVIADALPTSWILKLFDTWKATYADIRVMLFRVWRYEDRSREAAIHKSIDYVLYKPIDIEFVAHIVNGLFDMPRERASGGAA